MVAARIAAGRWCPRDGVVDLAAAGSDVATGPDAVLVGKLSGEAGMTRVEPAAAPHVDDDARGVGDDAPDVAEQCGGNGLADEVLKNTLPQPQLLL